MTPHPDYEEMRGKLRSVETTRPDSWWWRLRIGFSRWCISLAERINR